MFNPATCGQGKTEVSLYVYTYSGFKCSPSSAVDTWRKIINHKSSFAVSIVNLYESSNEVLQSAEYRYGTTVSVNDKGAPI